MAGTYTAYDTSSTDTIWYRWTSTSASTTTADYGDSWPQWTAGTSSTGATIWIGWNNSRGRYVARPTPIYQAPPVRQRTPEEIAADNARREKLEREQAERLEKQRAAVAKSTELLRTWLSDSERERFDKERKFHVITASGRRYEIDTTARHRNVFELDKRGNRLKGFCAYANDHQLPLPDNALAQKLLLEADEEAFRKVANQFDVAA